MTIIHSRGQYDVTACTLAEAISSLSEECRVITDKNVESFYGSLIPEHVPVLVLSAGEATKCLDQYGRSLEWLASTDANRRTTVVALGGGVIGDLAGFIAASYMRGVSLAQIPTTLLAMVDSSVGGKVGIDLESGKNLVGAFWPPTEVKLCIDALRTLPIREFRAGMAEVWKTGYILDVELLSWLRREPMDATTPLLEHVVTRCIDLKRQVVEEDEYETTGRRAILNFGHTIGHAIEQVTRYERFLHGEAISIGMVLEARLGERLGITPVGTQDVVIADLSGTGLPTELPADLSPEALLPAMRRDKKTQGKGLAFSFLTGVGECKLYTDVRHEDVASVIKNP